MIFGSSISFFVLPPEYNARMLLPQQVSGEVKIVHSRIKKPNHYYSQLAFVNISSTSVRVFNPNPRRIGEYLGATLKLFRRLSRGVRWDGGNPRADPVNVSSLMTLL